MVILNRYPATARNGTRMSGRRPEIPDDDILEFVANGADPAYGTTELASEFEYSQAGMHKRLNHLQLSGLLTSKAVGSSRIWWITLAGKLYLSE